MGKRNEFCVNLTWKKIVPPRPILLWIFCFFENANRPTDARARPEYRKTVQLSILSLHRFVLFFKKHLVLRKRHHAKACCPFCAKRRKSRLIQPSTRLRRCKTHHSVLRKTRIVPVFWQPAAPVIRIYFAKSKPSKTFLPLYFLICSSPSRTRIAPAAIASISNSPG